METNILTEQQFNAWRALHSIRMQLLPYLTQRLATHSDLSEAEFLVLVSLYESRAPAVRAKDLCRNLTWEISRLSHQITRMEATGLVKKLNSPDDARGFQVSLTDTGKQAIERALPLQHQEIKHCFGDILTAQQLDSLIEISEAIRKHIENEQARQG